MGLKNDKKGMFLTIMAIIMLSIFFLGYSIYSLSDDRSAINRRIDTMNTFLFSFEKDLSRELYISGFRIIFVFEKKIVDSGNPIDNVTLRFNEALFNGTLFQVSQDLMYGATFSDLQRSLSENALIMNMNGTIRAKKVSISQDNPWNIKITMETEIYLYELGNLASWNKTENITAYIPIENFEDPLYVLKSSGTVTNKIKRTIYSPLVNTSNINNLTLHYQNQYYINTSLAPSFLNRLEGKSDVDPNGIESLVDAQALSEKGIPIRAVSTVDYIYLNNNHTGSHQIKNMPSWFRIDDFHLPIYNVTGIAI
jgi:hypothetical protein